VKRQSFEFVWGGQIDRVRGGVLIGSAMGVGVPILIARSNGSDFVLVCASACEARECQRNGGGDRSGPVFWHIPNKKSKLNTEFFVFLRDPA
jgi:hypothetical protein